MTAELAPITKDNWPLFTGYYENRRDCNHCDACRRNLAFADPGYVVFDMSWPWVVCSEGCERIMLQGTRQSIRSRAPVKYWRAKAEFVLGQHFRFLGTHFPELLGDIIALCCDRWNREYSFK